jgi:hypothetical protein
MGRITHNLRGDMMAELVKATRASDGITVWVRADRVDGVEFISLDASVKTPAKKTKSGGKNAAPKS